jgi:hypothetical protein
MNQSNKAVDYYNNIKSSWEVHGLGAALAQSVGAHQLFTAVLFLHFLKTCTLHQRRFEVFA